MRRIVLSFPLYLALISGIHGFPFQHPQIEPRYSGYGSDGNVVQNSNDAEIGQLSGTFNALVNELQNSPKLANGPQAEAQRQADQAHKDEITPEKIGQTTEEPAETDATDAPPKPKMLAPPPTQNRVPANNFPPPQSQFNGPFNGPNNGPFNGPSNGPFGGPSNGPFGGPSNGPFGGPPQNMYTPPGPSPYAPPFGGPGPFGQGPYNQGGYDNGPYQGEYNQPQQQQVPSGNPGSYGADNAALQESGMGQLGHFFSSMVSELQNSGFNNNVETAIAPKRPVKPKVRATAATTTTPKTTTTEEE